MKIQLRTPESDKWQVARDTDQNRAPSVPRHPTRVTLVAPKQREGGRHASAFTLVELMLVVTIIGILAALVIPKIAGKSQEARIKAAFADVHGGIKSALDQYDVDNGSYPKSLQDLLVQPSNAKNWHGPYFDPPKLPVDPWFNPYIYYYPGKHNPTGYDLLSMGPDQKEGTDDDIGSWQ